MSKDTVRKWKWLSQEIEIGGGGCDSLNSNFNFVSLRVLLASWLGQEPYVGVEI